MAAFVSLLLASTLLGATANPAPYGYMEHYIAKRDTSFPSSIDPSCTDFVIGADGAASGSSSGSKVCVSVNAADHTLTVVYPTSPQGYSYTSEHVWVGCSKPSGTTSDGTNAPGKFPFTSDNEACTTSADKSSATCTFNIGTILKNCNSCDQSFNIITHVSLFKTVDGTTTSVTGAGKGQTYGNAWHRMYWTPKFYCLRTSTITFEPSTFFYTLESTTTITSVSTTSYTTTSTSVHVTTTTSTSIYDTTEYSTTIFPSTSTTTSTSLSTPATQYDISTCHKA